MIAWPDPIELTGISSRPGIYRWSIDDVPIYVGKFTHANRPLNEYRRNVEKIVSGRPYRPAKPAGFRRIHIALAEALQTGRKFRVEIVENCEASELNERERYWIAQLDPATSLNGRPKK